VHCSPIKEVSCCSQVVAYDANAASHQLLLVPQCHHCQQFTHDGASGGDVALDVLGLQQQQQQQQQRQQQQRSSESSSLVMGPVVVM
jgi:hypothetical protein